MQFPLTQIGRHQHSLLSTYCRSKLK